MSSIDIREKSLLREWAAANSDREIFEKRRLCDSESYFITRKREDTYIIPYQCETIPQLQQMINDVCMSEIDIQRQKMLSIAAFKCRETLEEDISGEEKKESVDRGKLPEFTYAF